MIDNSKKSNVAKALSLGERDNACLWHPFTPMRQWLQEIDVDETGRVIIEAEGFELIDQQGRRFIDGFSSLWCNLHGHRVEQIDSAIRSQLDKVAHTTLLGQASPPSIELAERLVRITPTGLDKVFYSDSGASAVEVALKMAYQFFHNKGHKKRQKILALENSYHGDTLGAVSVGGMETFHKIFEPLLFDVTFVGSPNPYHHPAGDQAGQVVLKEIEEILAKSPGEFCAMILEPLVQGAGGMLTHCPGFLAGVREITRRHGVLMIVDEVATGFCRTGKLFACEHEEVCPDLMCLGKGLTGGYLPVAATMASQEIFDGFGGEIADERTFFHGHTFTGNALGCAAAVASIDLIESSGLLKTLPIKIDTMQDRLNELADHDNVGDIRQRGMMVGIELVADRKKRKPFDPLLRTGGGVCLAARKRGLIIRPLGDVIVLMPAPAMDLETLDRMLRITIDTIKEYFV